MSYFLNDFLIFSNWKYLFYFIDIFVVACFIYVLYILLQKTKANRIVVGIGLLLFITFIARILGLSTLTWLFDKFFQVGIITMVIVFQSELKHGLTLLGGGILFRKSIGYDETQINKVLNASFNLSHKGFGALIIFQRKISLHTYIEKSIVLDAVLSSELIESIFYKNNPIHDGASIITQDRIAAASVYLPLTEIEHHIKNRRLGTRHRAALGISENTDAAVVVVSEETSHVSIVYNGKLYYNLTREECHKKLQNILEIQ